MIGALARTVADSALMLDVHARRAPDEPDPAPPFTGRYLDCAATAPRPTADRRSRARRRRGSWRPCRSISAAPGSGPAAILSDLGHDVHARDPHYGLAQITFLQTWLAGIAQEAAGVPDPTQLEPLTRQMAAAGRWLVPARRLAALPDARAAATRRITALWDDFDVLLTPGYRDDRDRRRGRFRASRPRGRSTSPGASRPSRRCST